MNKLVLISFFGLITICNICKPMLAPSEFAGLTQEQKDERLISFMSLVPDNEIEKLLKAGTNPNFVDKYGDTALIKAIFRKRPSSVELLLKYGADPNLGLPLSYAIKFGRTAEAKILLNDPRINVNASDGQGNTPLHEAARKDNLEIAKLLLNKGANSLIVNLNKMRPNDVLPGIIDENIFNNATEEKLAKIDINYFYGKKRPDFDMHPLHKAAYDGNLEGFNDVLKEMKITRYPNKILETDRLNLRVGEVVRLALKKIDSYAYDTDDNTEKEQQKKIRKENLGKIRERIGKLEEEAIEWAEEMGKRS